MNFKIKIALMTITLFISAGLAQANDKPYLGVKLDPNPLPELLVKHLRLNPDVGLLITNIQKDSPADKAGLEKDDIILRFNGDDITSYQQLVDAIRQAGIASQVELHVLQRGRRNDIKLTLEPYQSTIEWKYPFEQPTYLPGRSFKRDRDTGRWEQIPFLEIPNQQDYFKDFFQKSYRYEFNTQSADGKTDLKIIIDGHPDDDDTTITIEAGNEEYTCTVEDLDKLPAEYRDLAEEYLETARKNRPSSRFHMPHIPMFPHTNPFGNDDWPPRWNSAPNDFNERLEQLEKQQKEMLERLDKMLNEKDDTM